MNEHVDHQITQLRPSGYWNLSYIYIDDAGLNGITWSEAELEDWCSGKGTWGEPYIIENVTVEDAGYMGHGIAILYSNKPFIIRNCTITDSDNGIYLYQTVNGTVMNNTAIDNGCGIFLAGLVQNITIYDNILNNQYHGIYTSIASPNNRIINNTIYYGTSNGIRVSGNSCNITDNKITGNGDLTGVMRAGINVYSASNILIRDNSIINSSDEGIQLYEDCDNVKIINNTIEGSGTHGIFIDYVSDSVTILNNTIKNSGNSGIQISAGNTHTIQNNTIINNGNNGIQLSGGSFHTILDNNIMDSISNGIFLYGNHNSTVSSNNCTNNGVNGLLLEHSHYNNVSNNDFHNNTEQGIYINKGYHNRLWENDVRNSTINSVRIITASGVYSINNLFFQNSFINCPDHVIDGSSTNSLNQNHWNSSSIGNYWDDYVGFDENDDGIGDIPYDIYAPLMTGFFGDSLPIWDDGNDLPNFSVNLPSNSSFYGENSPTFDLSIEIGDLHTSWYRLNGGANYSFVDTSGTLDQSAWEGCLDGTVKLEFFINDTSGLVARKEIEIIKDTVSPVIDIISPSSNQLCGTTAPTFSLTIDELNIQEKFYSFNSGDNITFTSETQFNQTEWDKIGNGTVILTFYILDEAGNLNSSEIIIRKDAFIPNITIHSPAPDEIFGTISPEFNISIVEEDLDSSWYKLEGISTEFPISGLVDFIDQDAWDNLPQGELTLTFYAQDRAGNLNSKVITIEKDTNPPEITINSPVANEIFGDLAPEFTISIDEANLVSTWYQIEGIATEFHFSGLVGSIDQDTWDNLTQGEITITFYAQDILDSVGSQSIIVIKRIPSQSPIPGYNLVFLVGLLSIISLMIRSIVKKK